MTDEIINNIEEMTNKIGEYIDAVAEDEGDRQGIALDVACKFVLLSTERVADEGLVYTRDDIYNRLRYIYDIMTEVMPEAGVSEEINNGN